jgi:hypothetical protein
MRKDKGSKFVYTVDLDHESGNFGVYGFKTFYSRGEALDYCENLAVSNPDIGVSISIRPRFTKKNILAVG